MLAAALPLITRYWKPIVGVLVAGLLVWFMVHKWNNFTDSLREEGRLKGRAEVTAEVQKIVKDNNTVNRRVEAQVQDAVNAFADRLDAKLKSMSKATQAQVTIIEREIAANPQVYKNPQCVTPQSVIDARNAIRAQGPSSK